MLQSTRWKVLAWSQNGRQMTKPSSSPAGRTQALISKYKQTATSLGFYYFQLSLMTLRQVSCPNLVFLVLLKTGCCTTTDSECYHSNTHPKRRVNKNILEQSAPAEMQSWLLLVRLFCTWAKLRCDMEQGHLWGIRNVCKCWVFQLSQPIQIKATISSNHWSRLQHTSSVHNGSGFQGN